MTDLIKLAERVEALDGPDREVDLDISVAVNHQGAFEGFDAAWSVFGDEIWLTSHKEYVTKRGAVKRITSYLDPDQFVPKWTASMNAAVSLVNEYGCDIHIRAGVTTARCYLNENESVKATAKTPAIALTAAALRARSKT